MKRRESRSKPGGPAGPPRRDVQRFLEDFHCAGGELREVRERARKAIRAKGYMGSFSEWEQMPDAVYPILLRARPRKTSLFELTERNRTIANVLLRLRAEHQAVVKSGIVGLLRKSRRVTKRTRDAMAQVSEASSLARVFRRGAILSLSQQFLKIVEQEARDRGGRGLKALKYLEVAPGIRRLSEYGVPSSTIPELLRLVGIHGFTTVDVRNVLARKQ